MTGWSQPPFAKLDEAIPGLRWVASMLMDEEQYRVEGWERTVSGDGTYWRASRRGMVEYDRMRAQRRADRKQQWAAREQDDQQWLDSVMADGR